MLFSLSRLFVAPGPQYARCSDHFRKHFQDDWSSAAVRPADLGPER